MEGARTLDNKEETEREVHFKEGQIKLREKEKPYLPESEKTKAVPCK